MATAEGSVTPDPPKAAESKPDQNVCPECGKAFGTEQGLGAHRARAHGYRNEAKAAKAAKGAPPKGNGAPPDLPHEQRARVDRMYATISTSLIDDRSYSDKLQEFLPALAEEINRRGDGSLNDAFFALYLDAH